MSGRRWKQNKAPKTPLQGNRWEKLELAVQDGADICASTDTVSQQGGLEVDTHKHVLRLRVVKETSQDVNRTKSAINIYLGGSPLCFCGFTHTTGLGVVVADRNVWLQLTPLKKFWVHLNSTSNRCATSCNEITHLRAKGRTCAKENCIYKLFKLYEMHVMNTWLSIFIWCQNIFVLFIERRFLKMKIRKKKLKTDFNIMLGLQKGASQWDFTSAFTEMWVAGSGDNSCRKYFGNNSAIQWPIRGDGVDVSHQPTPSPQ